MYGEEGKNHDLTGGSYELVATYIECQSYIIILVARLLDASLSTSCLCSFIESCSYVDLLVYFGLLSLFEHLMSLILSLSF